MEGERETVPERRRLLWIEVLVVFLIFVAPALWAAFHAYIDPQQSSPVNAWLYAGGQTVHYLAIVPAVAFIAWGSGDSLRSFGLRAVPWWQMLSVSLATFLISRLARSGIRSLILMLAPQVHDDGNRLFMINKEPALHAYHPALWAALFAMGAFCEEFIMRGYFITRFRELLGSTVAAVLASTCLFALYHVYEGWDAVAMVFLSGIVYALAFLTTKSIWPSFIAHWAGNTLPRFFQ